MDFLIAKYEVRESGALLAQADRMPDNRPGWYITIFLKGNGGQFGKEMIGDVPDDEIVERLGWVARRVRDLEDAAGNLTDG